MKKFILNICFFIVSIFILLHSISWILEIPVRKAIKNGTHKKSIKWKDIKNRPYKNIIIGSSRGYCSYNPIILDSISGNATYNMCTGSQNFTESFYMLKEILNYQKPKVIVYEIFLPSFTNKPDFYHVMSNASFMSKKGKWDLIINGYKKQGLINTFNPLLKHIPYLKSDIKNLLNNKNKAPNSKWIQGYSYSNTTIDSLKALNFGPLPSLKTSLLKNKIKQQLNLLIDFCFENNLDLICVRAPYPKTRILKTPIDTVSVFFKQFLNQKKVPFYDFNYLEDSYYYDSDFRDYHHMNNKGAIKVSKQLGQILKTKLLKQ